MNIEFNNDDDPDFRLEAEGDEGGNISVTSSLNSNRLLRSSCSHGHSQLCHEGHGLQFNSRISPSPSRSFHRRRRRSHFRRSGDGSSSESAHQELTSARRDLSEDLARVERTSGWVANLHPFYEEKTLRLVTHRKVTQGQQETLESSMTRSHKILMEPGEVKTTGFSTFKATLTPPTPDPKTSSSYSGSMGSPRLKAFDGDEWKRSPRTGYTYLQTATYRDTWTPDREVPMPHMARWPLDKYPGIISARTNLMEAFSDNEEEEDVGTRSRQRTWSGTNFFTLYLNRLVHLFKVVLLTTFLIPTKFVPYSFERIIKRTTYIFQEIYQWIIQKEEVEDYKSSFCSFIQTIIFDYPSMLLPFLGPVHVTARLSSEAIEEEYIHRKRSLYIYQERSISNTKPKSLIELTSRVLGRMMKLVLNAPKTLVLLLLPTLITNASATSDTLDCQLGHRETINNNGPVVIKDYPGLNMITDHLPDLTLLQCVPDVRGAIKSTSYYIFGLVVSILTWLNPLNWKWPKISRRRVRRWRRHRRSRGPPTRFSARIRHMPVQFVGELPVVRRCRRPKPIIPAEILSVPKDIRVDRLVKEFESKVSQFNPGVLTRSISHFARHFGFFKEEEVELRRSARLRGLAPEFDGLQEVKRTRRSKGNDQNDQEDHDQQSLEQLLKPYQRTWTESFFAYWGYFSEKEIARRRSLRLQGLDPEFEGLTWGRRSRRRRRRAATGHTTRLIRRIFSYFWIGDYKEGLVDEGFFEYQDQTEDGRCQRLLDFVLHKIGYLHFEDIAEEEAATAAAGEIQDVLEENDVYEEDENAGYITIPSESFVNYQHQHEAFEDSYSFETTEGYDDEEEEEEDQPIIQLVKDGSSCLAVILLLIIPILLLISTLLLDNSHLMDWSTSFAFHTMQGAIHVMILCTGWMGSAFSCMIYAIANVLPDASETTILVEEQNTMPDAAINYDFLAEKLMQSDSFQKSVLKLMTKDDVSETEVSNMIDKKFAQVLDALKDMKAAEFSTDHLDFNKGTVDFPGQLDQFKTDIRDFTNAKLLNEETNQLDKEQLQQDLKMLENKVTDLLNEVKKCCSAASGCTETLSAIGRKASLEMLTYEDFKVALEEMEKKLEQHLTEISKKSILDILESERYLSTNNGTNYSNRKEDEIKDLVHSALLTYGADKTGAFDFALETAGGSVVSTRCTQMYTDRYFTFNFNFWPLFIIMISLQTTSVHLVGCATMVTTQHLGS